ncbi:YjfB family protein [Clostridium isatidis]|uniref:YjfB family protein n=1 Tax=Clostridium isatidis TaxID=182773 RepID=UPI003AB06E97
MIDIAPLSTSLNQAKVTQQTSLAVMKLAMETGKQTANEQVKMIEKSKDPNLGKVIDKSV